MDVLVAVIFSGAFMVLAPLVLFWAYRRASRRRRGRLAVPGRIIVTYLIGIEAVSAGFIIFYVAHAGWTAVPHTVLFLVAIVALAVGVVCLLVPGPALWANRPRRED